MTCEKHASPMTLTPAGWRCAVCERVEAVKKLREQIAKEKP